MKRTHTAALWAVLACGCGSAGTADGTDREDASTPTCGSREIMIEQTCTTNAQLCEPPLTYDCIGGEGTLEIEFTTAATHCSDMRFLVSVDSETKPASAFLGPSESTGPLDFGVLSSGAHVISVQAEGREGGCNPGYIANWGGTLRISVTAP